MKELTDKQIRETLIRNGVNNLKKYGYPKVDKSSILTDYVYASFFLEMLKDNLGNGQRLDKVINKLIKDVTDGMNNTP